MYSKVLFIQQLSATSDASATVDGDSSVVWPEQIGRDAACYWTKETSDEVCWCSLGFSPVRWFQVDEDVDSKISTRGFGVSRRK